MRFLFLNADIVADMQISFLSKCKVPCIIHIRILKDISEQKKWVLTEALYVIVSIWFITRDTTGMLVNLCLDSMARLSLYACFSKIKLSWLGSFILYVEIIVYILLLILKFSSS